MAVDADLHALFWFEVHVLRQVLPHHAPDLCVFVLQGEIAVPRGRTGEIREFTFHPHVVVVRFNEIAEAARKLGDGEHGRAVGTGHEGIWGQSAWKRERLNDGSGGELQRSSSRPISFTGSGHAWGPTDP